MVGKPFVIPFCPLCQRPIRYAHVLQIARPLERWQVICCEGAWCHFISDKDGLEHVVYMAMVAAPNAEQMRLI